MIKEINFSEKAVERINQLIAKKPSGTFFRIAVQGGGCSGFKYDFSFDNKIDENDSNRGRNQGLILSSLAIVLMLFMMPIQEDLDDSMEMYGQYLSEYGTDTYEMIALLSENDLTFEQ